MEIYVFIDGAKKSLTQLAAESGESYDTILRRYKAGVPADQLVPKKETGGGGGVADFDVGDTLTFKDGVLSVNTTDTVAAGNLLPITSAGVQVVVGNTNASLDALREELRQYVNTSIDNLPTFNSTTLLWKNASPTSSFSGQTITVDLSVYDFYLVTAMASTSSQYVVSNMSPVDNGGLLSFSWGDNAAPVHRSYVRTSGGIQFYGAYYNKAGNQSYLLPYKIYGIKGVG